MSFYSKNVEWFLKNHPEISPEESSAILEKAAKLNKEGTFSRFRAYELFAAKTGAIFLRELKTDQQHLIICLENMYNSKP